MLGGEKRAWWQGLDANILYASITQYICKSSLIFFLLLLDKTTVICNDNKILYLTSRESKRIK